MELIERKQILNSDVEIKPLYQREFDDEENIYSSGLMTRKRIVNSNKFVGGKDPYSFIGSGLDNTTQNNLTTALGSAIEQQKINIKQPQSFEHVGNYPQPSQNQIKWGQPSNISVDTKNIATDDTWKIPSYDSMMRTPNIQIPNSNKQSSGGNWGQSVAALAGAASQTFNTWSTMNAAVKDSDTYLNSGGYTTKYRDGVGYTAYKGVDYDEEMSKIDRLGAQGLFSETANGAATGAQMGGGYGAIIGAVIGLGSGAFNWITGHDDADRQLRKAIALKNSRNAYASTSAESQAMRMRFNDRYVNPNSGILYARRGKDIKYRV